MLLAFGAVYVGGYALVIVGARCGGLATVLVIPGAAIILACFFLMSPFSTIVWRRRARARRRRAEAWRNRGEPH